MDASIVALDRPEQAPAKPKKTLKASPVKHVAQQPSLFHQDWWLAATSGNRFSMVEIEEAGAVVGRLPFVTTRPFGMTILRMPPFTHVLGPIVDCGEGKHQTLLKNRIKLTKQLIERLPKFDYFSQICDASADGGLAQADGLAFQECGFRVGTQYTFRVDCRKTLETLFAEMHLKTRQHIRLAEKSYSVIPVYEPTTFTAFYLRSLQLKNKTPNVPMERFPELYLECRKRDCGQIFAAIDERGTVMAMTFLVWDKQTMFYLLSARSPDHPDKGAVSQLIWTAMTHAHERGLVFDLDGVSTTGTAQFLTGFGGELGARMTVAKARPLYSTLQHFGRLLGHGNTSNYT